MLRALNTIQFFGNSIRTKFEPVFDKLVQNLMQTTIFWWTFSDEKFRESFASGEVNASLDL